MNVDVGTALRYDNEQLGAISKVLAVDPQQRALFVANPAQFLRDAGVDVGDVSYAPLEDGVLRTSEECTGIWLCVAAIAVAVAVGWLVGVVGSYAVYSFAACKNLAWGCGPFQRSAELLSFTSDYV